MIGRRNSRKNVRSFDLNARNAEVTTLGSVA